MPDFAIEDQYQGRIAGIDEVGRGPLAGPVVAAAVILPRDGRLPVELLSELNDSKKLSVKKRDHLYGVIMNCAEVGIGAASVREIDQINILQATYVAMRRAVSRLGLCLIRHWLMAIATPGCPVRWRRW